MLTEQTLVKLRDLRLHCMADHYDDQRRQPTSLKLSFDERFGQLVDAEHAHQHDRANERRLEQAKLKYRQARLEDLSAQTRLQVDSALLQRLCQCDWVRYGQHVLLTGATGVGKTYLACALAHQACRHGFTVRYLHGPKLFRALQTAQADGSFNKLLRQLGRVDLLLIDDWGLQIVRRGQYRDLLELLEERHDKALLVTSQYHTDQWHQIIDDDTVADAICDRLLQQAYHLNLQGESARHKQPEH